MTMSLALTSLFLFRWCGQYLGTQNSLIYMLYNGSLNTIYLFPQKCRYEERRKFFRLPKRRKINSIWLQMVRRSHPPVTDNHNDVDSGIPQGTVLGLLLFLCHINNIPNIRYISSPPVCRRLTIIPPKKIHIFSDHIVSRMT